MNLTDMTTNQLIDLCAEYGERLGVETPRSFHTKADAIARAEGLIAQWEAQQPAPAPAADLETSATDERTGAERLGIRPWDGPYAEALHSYKVQQLTAAQVRTNHRNVWERAAFYGFGSVNDYMESQFFNNMKYRLREKGAPQDEIAQVTALFKLAEDKKVTKTRGKLEVDTVGV